MPHHPKLLLRTLHVLELLIEHGEGHRAHYQLAIYTVARAFPHHERGGAISADAHGFGYVGLHAGFVFFAIHAILELLRIELEIGGEAHDVAHIELIGIGAHGFAELPKLALLSGTASRLSRAHRVRMEVQRSILAEETHLAGIDVVLLDIRI